MISAIEHHRAAAPACRICGTESLPGHTHEPTGICRGCAKKIGAVLLTVMVVLAFILFFGIF
jgi:hypothetical protein